MPVADSAISLYQKEISSGFMARLKVEHQRPNKIQISLRLRFSAFEKSFPREFALKFLSFMKTLLSERAFSL